MVSIIQNGHPTLRKVAKEVHIAKVTEPKIKKVLKDMAEALHREDDGVAIAAPQINVPLRIFIVNGKIFEDGFERGKKESLRKTSAKKIPDMVFVNPVFKKISKDKKLLAEGCLSVRPLYGKVRRATRATVEAYDEHGKKFTKSGSGLLAHIFQHEIDHLEGILFIDKARDIHESTPEEEYK